MKVNKVMGQDYLILLFASLIYASIGMPIPESVGVPELLVGMILSLLVIRQYLFINNTYLSINPLVYICVLWIVIVPTVIGIILRGNSLGSFVRDFFPILFMLLPFFLIKRLDYNPVFWVYRLSNLIILVGTLLSLRFISSESVSFESLNLGDTAPLNQCPSVIFAAVAAFYFFWLPRYNIFLRLLYLIASVICLSGLMMIVMRAQIAIILISWILVMFYIASKSKRALLYVLLSSFIIFTYILIFHSEEIAWTIEMIGAKNDAAGLLNSRDAELLAIFALLKSNVFTFLFGEGWGSMVYLQTAGKVVKYTHNSTLFYLWKLGFVGYIFYFIYWINILGIKKLLINFSSIFKKDFPLLLACIASLLVFGVIEMGYKILTFSLVAMVFRAIVMSHDFNRIND